jgi:hypothetical protein
MENQASQFEQRLNDLLKKATKERDAFAKRLEDEHGLHALYEVLLARAREAMGKANSKDLIKAVEAATPDLRLGFAFHGPAAGVPKTVIRNLSALGLSGEEKLTSAILCIVADAESTFPYIREAGLPVEEQLMMVIAAIKTHPRLDYEEYKTTDVVFQYANPDHADEYKEAKQRYDLAQNKRIRHVKNHPLKLMPDELKQSLEYCFTVLHAALSQDAFGSLEVLRDSASGFPLAELKIEEKLELIKIISNQGLGLASVNLNLFGLPEECDDDILTQLKNIFRKDATAGSNIIGAYALEGIQNYPFGLEKIDLTLPRRITRTEALDMLNSRPADAPEGRPAPHRSGKDIASATAKLQEMEVQRFFDSLKAEIAHKWKAIIGPKKKEILFADTALKVREIIFLVANSIFVEEQVFEDIFQHLKKTHPTIDQDEKLFILANRQYFLDLLGLHPTMLFAKATKRNAPTLIEEVGDFQIRRLLHLGMSIYIRSHEDIFKDMPIAWIMLLGQYEGVMDHVFQDLGLLFDAFDTLLTILEGKVPDMREWTNRVWTALHDNVAELPDLSTDAQPGEPQHGGSRALVSKAIIHNSIECLNNYCVQALLMRAEKEENTPINIIRTLKIDKNKSGKLLGMVTTHPKEEEPKAATAPDPAAGADGAAADSGGDGSGGGGTAAAADAAGDAAAAGATAGDGAGAG